MSNSAYCSANGTNISLSGTSGLNVASASTLTIRLVNPAGVQNWSILCTGVDEITNLTAINNSISQNNTNFSATFTMPTTSFGAAMQFTSITNQSTSAQNTFTFGIFILYDGYRLFFGGESDESNMTVGNTADLNKMVRAITIGATGGFTAGGDLSGTSTSQNVIQIQGYPVSSATPSAKQIMIVNHAGTQWKPASISGDISASSSTDGKLTVNSIQGITITGAPIDGYLLTATSTSAATWQVAPSGLFAAGGDLAGSATNQTVESIQGIAISGTPSAGQALLAGSSSAAAWANITTISGVTISGTASNGKVLGATSSSAATWITNSSFTAGGDLTGTSSSQQVQSLTGSGGVITSPNTTSFQLSGAADNGGGAGVLSFGAAHTNAYTISTAASIFLGSGGAALQIVPPSSTSQALQVSNAGLFSCTGYNFYVNTTSATASNMVGGIIIAKATTNPSNSISNSQIYADSGNGNISFMPSSTTSYVINMGASNINYNGVNILWTSTSPSPSISQANDTTNGDTAQNLTISAQNATGTTSTGGNLLLSPGTGTSANGNIQLQSAITQQTLTGNALTEKYVQVLRTTSSGATAVTCYTIPNNSACKVEVTVVGRTGSSGGGGTGANACGSTWTGKLVNSGGSVTVFGAFAVSDTFQYSGTLSAASWTLSNTGATISANITPGITTGTNWMISTEITSIY
jgi:hypothetical protein